ncbi:hypothetical protein B0T26DRAFT_794425 [Lasiosphaeria miniovina]|uniref:Alternative oxidase n=1 Tax=Lasiosphaeria miniovina TaxID=1954250 RepID=A0AA39ZUI4_9PEZI|nr:uncharacterized protein B0T26DRAFT_794425 [Lasiosphaeria miniovina]KAK0703937.1 hypothetical protein B0T26DRAFT_794425 [Lasiosphaeria miniovina]
MAAIMFRHRSVLVVVCIVSLATLWSCRLPKMCLYNQCNADITVAPLSRGSLDLSLPDAPFIGWPLARVCAETTWTAGTVFVCDDNSGGVGNMRSYILTCVRYAVEAGVQGLVLPRLRTRSSSDLASIMQDHAGFDYLFDEQHFRSHLAAACPQLAVYGSTSAIPGAADQFRAEALTPHNLGRRGGCDQREPNKHTAVFGAAFRAHVRATAAEFGLPPPSAARPRAYRFTWGVQFDWPVARDGPEFAATFGGLLRFRADILELARRTTGHMRQFAAQQQQQQQQQKLPLPVAATRAFAGMHLRTESDALGAWPRFENQSAAYIRQAAARGFGAAYLATGNETEAQRLTAAAAAAGVAVTTKHMLLSQHAADAQALAALTWDQQALVDFVVLLECDYFLGVSPSSFSINVALKRHLKGEGLLTRPWRVGGEGDGRSWLVGSYEHYWKDWLFIYDSMWP